MSEQEQEQKDPLAQAEEQRQRNQAQPEQDRLARERDTEDERRESDEASRDIDPASPEGQQAAMRRGDPVQLQGDEMLAGRRLGVNTTHNESLVNPVAPQSGPRGPNFVTGAGGEPIPAGEGVEPERPSVGAEDFRVQAPEGGGEEVPGAPYEQSERERAQRAESEYAERREPPEDKPDAEDDAELRETQGAEGPGVSQ